MNPGVKFIRHQTVKNGSDHDALFVDVVLVNQDGYRDDLRIAEWNIGNGSYNDMCAVLREAGKRSVVAFLEAGGRKRHKQIQMAAKTYGFTVIWGLGLPGQASTPLLVGPNVEIRQRLYRLLLDRVKVGWGAGPSYNKPKWWLGGRFRVGRNPFKAKSAHNLASMQNDTRFHLAQGAFAPVIRRSKRSKYVLFTILDINSDTDERFGKWIVDQGMTSNHHELGRIPTRMNRAIDWVMVAKNKVLTDKPSHG